MADMNRVISYTFQLKDNVTGTAQKMESATKSADAAVRNLTAQEQNLDAQVRSTTNELQKQQLTIVTQLTSLMALQSSVSAVTGGITGLGIVSDETAKQLQKVNAAFSLFTGSIQLITSLKAVMSALNITTAGYATIMTYLTALKNPLAIGLIGAGVGAAAGVGAYLLTQNNNSTSNQTSITINDTASNQAVAQEVFYIQGALK